MAALSKCGKTTGYIFSQIRTYYDYTQGPACGPKKFQGYCNNALAFKIEKNALVLKLLPHHKVSEDFNISIAINLLIKYYANTFGIKTITKISRPK